MISPPKKAEHFIKKIEGSMAIQSINLGKKQNSHEKLAPVAATPTKSIKGGKQERSAS